MTRLRELIRREPQRGFSIPPWLERLLSTGIVTRDPQVARRQRCVNAAIYAGAVSGASYIGMTSAYDFHGLLLLNLHNVLLIALGLVLPWLHRFGDNVAAIALVTFFGIGQTYVVWMLGITSDLHVFFLLGGIMLFFFGIRNWKLFAGMFVYIAALLLFVINFAPVDGYLLPTDGRLRDMISSQTMLSVLIIYAAMTFYALTLVHSAEVQLEQAHERSEALIGTIMPDAIAARLKASEARIADRIETLSVVFADLVGFTAAAHDLPPEESSAFSTASCAPSMRSPSSTASRRSRRSATATWRPPASTDARVTARSRSGASRWRCWKPMPRTRRSAAAGSNCASASIAGPRPPA